MHKVRTGWPVATRVQYIVAFQECRRRWPGLNARRFCAVAEIPYSTFARWWARWQREGSGALGDRPRRPRHCPTALQGRLLDIIRGAHRELGWGVRRLYAYLRQAGLIRCSLSSVYRVLRRCGALVRRPRKPKPVWTRYAKENPGERAQMDLKYLPQGRFQLTLVDDCSRFLAATVLERRTTAAVCRALPRLLKTIPFPPASAYRRTTAPSSAVISPSSSAAWASATPASGHGAPTSTGKWNASSAPSKKSSGTGSGQAHWRSGSVSCKATSASTTGTVSTVP